MGSNLNETQILTAALLTAGIGTKADGTGVESLLTSSKNTGCLKLGAVKEYTGGPDKIDACYVGETESAIILAFRGTETQFDNLPDDIGSIIDWLNDFKAEPVAMAGTFPGKVHTGFASSVIGLSRLFMEDVRGRLGQNKALVVTGYSKGAAMAPLASWLLHSNGIKVDEVHIYEPPRCGDTDFAKAFHDAFPKAVRYEYQDDLVPHTPPTQIEWQLLKQNLGTSNGFVQFLQDLFPDIDSWNYWPVGTLEFANWNTPPQIVTDTIGLELARLMQIANDFSQDPGVLLQDHDPNGHLFDAVKQNTKPPCDCNCPS